MHFHRLIVVAGLSAAGILTACCRLAQGTAHFIDLADLRA